MNKRMKKVMLKKMMTASYDEDCGKFGFTQMDVVVSYVQGQSGISDKWILLDYQSNLYIFSNKKLPTNICNNSEI